MTEPRSNQIDATASSTTKQSGDEEADEWVEEDENYDDDDYDDGEEEAEEIARRLKEQLWADISKAQADRVNVTTTASTSTPGAPLHDGVPSAVPSPVPITQPPLQPSMSSKKEEAALKTMGNVLNIAGKDPLVHSTLASAVVPGAGNSVLEILNHTVAAGTISKDLAKSLSMTLVSLARSDALFAALRHSNAPALQLDKGKRKRDETEEEQRRNEPRAFKRPTFAHGHLQSQITDAVRVVSETLASHPPSNGPPDPSIISSIQLQLHQIFLFAVTSSARGGPETNALQEISGLIQVVGVLSGSPIGPTAVPPNAHMQPPDVSMYPPRPWIPPGTGPQPVPFSDIGTAVYPCLVPGCRKIFARLFNLRAHQQVHAVHRPYRCAACPASFARNHDLKRHAKLHDKTGYQCAGCYKLFSRRDAIKRHKNSSATRGGKGEACVNAAIKEVELDKESGDDALREGRRTRMWADIVTHSVASTASYGTFGDDWGPEEGEMDVGVIGHAQEAVLSLHKTLQSHVSSALGTAVDHDIPSMQVDPAGSQATLASVIARAQLQNMPASQTQQDNSAVSAANHSMAESQLFPVDDGCGASNNDYLVPIADSATVAAPPLSLYGLSEEQARLLEQAIANAASAAQAQAEAEAALEEQEEDYEEDCDEDDGEETISTFGTEVPSTLGQ